jgi:hypothetical protein
MESLSGGNSMDSRRVFPTQKENNVLMASRELFKKFNIFILPSENLISLPTETMIYKY